jgi:hypothetical protein
MPYVEVDVCHVYGGASITSTMVHASYKSYASDLGTCHVRHMSAGGVTVSSSLHGGAVATHAQHVQCGACNLDHAIGLRNQQCFVVTVTILLSTRLLA